MLSVLVFKKEKEKIRDKDKRERRGDGRGKERGNIRTEGKRAWTKALVLLGPLPQRLHPEGSPFHANAWSTTQSLSHQPLK